LPLQPPQVRLRLRLLGAAGSSHQLPGDLQVAFADQAADGAEVVAQPLGKLAGGEVALVAASTHYRPAEVFRL